MLQVLCASTRKPHPKTCLAAPTQALHAYPSFRSSCNLLYLMYVVPLFC
jgi:hypothetical protein